MTRPPDQPTTPFAERLRAAREAAGMTQAQAADAAGIRQPDWSDYETGNVQPSLAQAARLAQAIGARLRDLI